MTRVLEVTNVHKYFGGVRAVQGVSLTVQEGRVVGLIGPNGSGKSTLLNVVAGGAEPTALAVMLGGRRDGNMPPPPRGGVRGSAAEAPRGGGGPLPPPQERIGVGRARRRGCEAGRLAPARPRHRDRGGPQERGGAPEERGAATRRDRGVPGKGG